MYDNAWNAESNVRREWLNANSLGQYPYDQQFYNHGGQNANDNNYPPPPPPPLRDLRDLHRRLGPSSNAVPNVASGNYHSPANGDLMDTYEHHNSGWNQTLAPLPPFGHRGDDGTDPRMRMACSSKQEATYPPPAADHHQQQQHHHQHGFDNLDAEEGVVLRIYHIPLLLLAALGAYSLWNSSCKII